MSKIRKKGTLQQWGVANERIICICHDIERGLGHIDINQTFAKRANQISMQALETMLNTEKEMGVIATYNEVGSFLEEILEKIQTSGHCIAFHSYDQNMWSKQLVKCRSIDKKFEDTDRLGAKLPPS